MFLFNRKVLIVLMCFLAIFAIGCKSTPEPETPPPIEEKQPEPEPEPEPQPEPEPAKPDFSAENASLIQQISDAKNNAIAEGAKDLYSAEFDAVTKYYDDAKKSYDAGGDGEQFNKTAKDALLMYQALASVANAKKLKNQIDEKDFAKYAEEKYLSGSNSLEKATTNLASPDKSTASETLEAAEQSVKDFTDVLAKGYSARALETKTGYSKIKKEADELKSAKADKEGYSKATGLYSDAEKNLMTGKFPEALSSYDQAVKEMTAVVERVKEKKARAEEAIERAKAKTAKSHEFAEEADQIAPLEGEDPPEEDEEVEAKTEEPEEVKSTLTEIKAFIKDVHEEIQADTGENGK